MKHRFASGPLARWAHRVTPLLLAVGVMTERGFPTRPDDTEWHTYLVQVRHIAAQDLSATDAERLKELQQQVDQAETPIKARAAQRALERATQQINTKRDAIIYGWTQLADVRVKPVENRRTISVFFLPNSATNRKTLINLKPGDFIAIDRDGARDLFSFAGRRHVAALRCAPAQHDADFGDGAFEPPPTQPFDETLHKAISTKLTFSKSEKHENGGMHYRYSLKIEVDDVAADLLQRDALEIWIHARFKAEDGEVLGPVLEHIKLKRSPQGNLAVTRSFEVITKPGITLDSSATTIDLVAAR
jgi:hypothetical protein